MSRLGEIVVTPECLAAARAGDAAARGQLYGLVAGPVHALIRRIVGPDAADDLFQDTLLRMFERLPAYRGDAPIGRWVRAIAVNHCLMHLRSPWRRARVWLGGGGTTAPFDSAETGADPFDLLPATAFGSRDASVAIDLSRLLAQLPPAARAVLWLYEVEGCSHDEIARAHGRSVSYSKSRLARAHAQLRALAAGEEPWASVPKHN
jgi:RNA polymerase sigma-70 factor (ECF subfamily)